MKRNRSAFLRWLLGLPLMFMVVLAQAVTVSISPSGNVTTNNVRVVVTVTTTGGGTPTLAVKVDGVDVSSYFNQGANFSTSGTTTTARVEYLFGGGTKTVSATATVAGEGSATGTTTFVVPGDVQESRKNNVLSKVNEFLHRWDAYDFHRWVSAGNYSTFVNRMWAPAMQVYVDPGFLASIDSAAAYVESYVWKYIWTIYDQDLVVSAEPETDAVAMKTLWHEMIHAVSHGAQVAGGTGLPGDDHIYIGWAERCTDGFDMLRIFEGKAKAYGISNPTAAQATEVRGYWKRFMTDYNGSSYSELGKITDAQKATLQALVGFNCDANAIKSGYLSAGYSPLYFADIAVTITSPASGTETASNQTLVSASVVNNEPTVTLSRAGFAVNGVTQETSLSGTTFSTTAVLKTGDNSIIAGVMDTAGQIYQSRPITVKSTALNNTYHARISWDKNDTDVDLHFSWSGGSECYYSNKTPTWGTAATSPRLDVDNTKGYGPENITIGGLPGTGTFKVWVRYYSDHGKGATTVSAAIYENGVAKFTGMRTMSSGENWTLMEFTIN